MGFTDSDCWAEISGRKSTSGFVYMCLEAAVVWGSRKKSFVAVSTCEVEYMALSLTVQEALWQWGFIGEMDSA